MTLLDQLETEARQRAVTLYAQGKLPHPEQYGYGPLTETELIELRRYKAAGLAARDVDTYVAMCKGDIVPEHRLDPGLLDYHRRRTQHRRPPTGASGG